MTSDEIKRSVSMREIVERYGIQIDRKGFCCCPFHKEKTGSMKIYKDSYHCFGCGESGDIFTFAQKMENLTFKEVFYILGGSYEDKSDHQRNLYHYHLKKRKESELKRRQREEQERIDIINEIHLQKLFKQMSPVFSDDWCDAVNRLEYLFNRLDYLTEKR